MKTNKTAEKAMKINYMVDSFMSNVRKLDEDVHRRTHGRGAIDCTVSLKTPGYCNNGVRRYAVSGSKLIRNGVYGYAGLRTKLREALSKHA